VNAAGYIRLDEERCDGCGGCVAVCAPLALVVSFDRVDYDDERCTACGECVPTCPRGALAASS
jgi:ferredoxin